MNEQNIVNLLHGTLDPNRQQEATNTLTEMHKIIGFAPMLLKVVMCADVEPATRHSGAVYLKNLISKSWTAPVEKTAVTGGGVDEFSIHEQDRAIIRQAIIDAAVHAPDVIRQHLGTCIRSMAHSDFPEPWTNVVDKIDVYLQTADNHKVWHGALVCLYQMTKVYEFMSRKQLEKRRSAFVEAMQSLLPRLQQRLTQLASDTSEPAVLTQKLVLKIFYRYIERDLPLNQLTQPVFTGWMEAVSAVAARAVPAEVDAQYAPAASSVLHDDDDDERATLCWWKCRKWAVRLLTCVLERYGHPGRVAARYNDFSRWYLKAFSHGTLEVVLSILNCQRCGQYVSPVVLELCLDYLAECAQLAHPWSLVREHMPAIIKQVLFPLLCFTDKDAQLWHEDPCEFVRSKYDYSSDYMTVVSSARALLETTAGRRKGVLADIMAFVVQILTAAEPYPRHVDGALHIVGTLSSKLLARKMYKNQLETMLVGHVFPLFNSNHGFLRARACSVVESLSRLSYQNPDNEAAAVNALVGCLLCNDNNLNNNNNNSSSGPGGVQLLPVQVEAALAVSSLVDRSSASTQALLQPHVHAVVVRLLETTSRSGHSELTDVLQQLVRVFGQQLLPTAVQLASHLLQQFCLVLDTLAPGGDDDAAAADNEGDGEREDVAGGLLNTMDLMMDTWEDETEVTAQLEPIFIQAVVLVLGRRVKIIMDEALQVVTSLTMKRVSADMWKVFEMMYKFFEDDGVDFFDDMMPSLHNYITVDTAGLLAEPARLEAIFTMCRAVLTDSTSGLDHHQLHAAKLLECVVLQCAGRIQQCLPSFIQLAMERLSRPMSDDSSTEQLQAMLLQLLLSVLYTEPQLFITSLANNQLANTQMVLLDHFVQLCIDSHKHFTSIHSRKLYVLSFCVLLRISPAPSSVVQTQAGLLLDILLYHLNHLKRAYKERAQDEEEESESESELADDQESLDEDEDEIDEDGANYLDAVQRRVDKKSSETAMFDVSTKIIEDEDVTNDDEDDDEDDDEVSSDGSDCYVDSYADYTTTLDATLTDDGDPALVVDEFVVLRDTLEHVRQQQQQQLAGWHAALTATERQQALRDMCAAAELRRAAAHAAIIKKQGGYNFEQKTVPNSFDFGSSNGQFGHT